VNYIFLNLKRFDIQAERGGVNRIALPREWGSLIAASIHEGIRQRDELKGLLRFATFMPEAHIPATVTAIPDGSPLEIGCQSVHYEDTSPGGNFGAFTTLRTANAMSQLGCTWTIIGHSEERQHMTKMMMLAGATSESASRAIFVLLNKQVHCALNSGLNVLFCIGETTEQITERNSVLRHQIEEGLKGADLSHVVLAYEPIWAIGPGKIPPEVARIAAIAADIKKIVQCPLVYGGGLKKENATSIGSIEELDGGLVALTRFSGEIGFYPEEFFEIVDAYSAGTVKAGAK
jgi:triosephosphate isomerase